MLPEDPRETSSAARNKIYFVEDRPVASGILAIGRPAKLGDRLLVIGGDNATMLTSGLSQLDRNHLSVCFVS